MYVDCRIDSVGSRREIVETSNFWPSLSPINIFQQFVPSLSEVFTRFVGFCRGDF